MKNFAIFYLKNTVGSIRSNHISVLVIIPNLEIIGTLCIRKSISIVPDAFPNKLYQQLYFTNYPLMSDLAISASPSDHLQIRLFAFPAQSLFFFTLPEVIYLIQIFLHTTNLPNKLHLFNLSLLGFTPSKRKAVTIKTMHGAGLLPSWKKAVKTTLR